MRTVSGMLAASLLVVGPLIGAQENVATRADAQSDTTATSWIQDAAADVILQAGEEGALLTSQVGWRTYRPNHNLIASIQFKAPLQDKEEEVGFLNLVGLTGNTSAKASLTWEISTVPSGAEKKEKQKEAEESMQRICRAANQEALDAVIATSTDLPSDGSCSQQVLDNDPYWGQILASRWDAALWEACQEVNKKRPTGLLAPPHVLSDLTQSGYGKECSEKELVAARTDSLEDMRKTKGEAALVEQCKKVNENRVPNSPLFVPEGPTACNPANLANHLVNEEIAAKRNDILVAVCHEARVVPSSQLLTRDTCKLSTLASHTTPKHGPHYWRRKALRAIPFGFNYVTVEFGRVDQEFKFLEPESQFSEHTRDDDSRSSSIAFSTYRHGWLGSLGYTRRTDFEAAKSTEVCLPLAQEGALSCRQAALSGPSRTDRDIYHAEVRSWFTPRLGTTIRSSYDDENSGWEHHLILHFLRDPSKGLRGGIDLQYASKVEEGEENFTGRLFVGTKFELPLLSP